MKRKGILITLVIAFATTGTSYSNGENFRRELHDFSGKSFQSFQRSDVPDEYFIAFFGNNVKEGNHLTRNIHRNLKPIKLYYPVEKYLYDAEKRTDFGNYDLFRSQVEGYRYNPRAYYSRPLPKSRTNQPGFAQRVVFEDELPFRQWNHARKEGDD